MDFKGISDLFLSKKFLSSLLMLRIEMTKGNSFYSYKNKLKNTNIFYYILLNQIIFIINTFQIIDFYL